MSLDSIKTEIIRRKTKLELIDKEIDEIKNNLGIYNDSLIESKEALKIIQTVAKQTQQNIEYHINNLITSCLQNIGKNYKFNCEFVIRRDKTECDMFLSNKSGERLDPYDEVGGSILQICEFALRCSLWSLQRNRLNNFLFLDEPFTAIRKNLYSKLISIVKEISKKLNLQLIIITHDSELIELGDNIINLSGTKENICIEYGVR